MSLVMKPVNADIFPAADIFPYFRLPPWQGWKLTFLGRRQLATDLFFSRQMGKYGDQL